MKGIKGFIKGHGNLRNEKSYRLSGIKISKTSKGKWSTKQQEALKKVWLKNKGKHPWNYGKKTGLVPKTAFKKGVIPKGAILFKKGHIPWSKGKHLSESAKNKIRAFMKTRPLSPNSGFKKGGIAPMKGRRNYKITGEKHYQWKGGITSVAQQIRHCPEYINWRIKVFERDNYTCLHCEQRGGRIVADHFPLKFSTILEQNNIKSFNESLTCKILWDINNGRTLCELCHNKSHKKNHD